MSLNEKKKKITLRLYFLENKFKNCQYFFQTLGNFLKILFLSLSLDNQLNFMFLKAQRKNKSIFS